MLQSCVLAQENIKYDLSGRLKETECIPAPPKQGTGVLKHAKKVVGDFWKHPQKFDIIMS